MKRNIFFFVMFALALQIYSATSHAFTMRAVSPESMQRPVSASPATVPKDEDSQTPDEIDFDDDFSVLV